MGLAFGRDLALLHGFEQRTLGLGAGTVDFVGQQYLGKHRPGVEHKSLLAAIVDGDPREVAGHEVGGELHT